MTMFSWLTLLTGAMSRKNGATKILTWTVESILNGLSGRIVLYSNTAEGLSSAACVQHNMLINESYGSPCLDAKGGGEGGPSPMSYLLPVFDFTAPLLHGWKRAMLVRVRSATLLSKVMLCWC